LTPIAGILADRWNRKRLMMVGDLTAVVTTLVLLVLYLAGTLEIWHLYAAAFISGAAGKFQSVAYTAAMTTLIPKQHYARASGMLSLSQYGAMVLAPLLAGLLMTTIGLAGILLIDGMTFLAAVGTLARVTIPAVTPKIEPENDRKESLLNQVFSGFKYVLSRPGLAALWGVMLVFVATEAIAYPLVAPMILARSGGDEAVLGLVQAVMGIGGVVGGTWLVIKGGLKRHIRGVVAGLCLTGFLGDALMGTGQHLIIWLAAGFCLEAFIPLAIGSWQTIWRVKVPPELQGRVFAAAFLLNDIVEPLAMITGGLLVDHVLEPAMRPDGSLAPIFGGIVGTGAGAGMGLLLLICGILSGSTALAGFLFPALREVETRLPDYAPVEIADAE
jgi:MFS family permease